LVCAFALAICGLIALASCESLQRIIRGGHVYYDPGQEEIGVDFDLSIGEP
jgi:hypothetical protein